MLVITALLMALCFSGTSNLINYFSHRCNAVAVTENVKLQQFGWMKRKVSGFGHTSAAWREQMWGWWHRCKCDDDWLDGRLTPCSRCLTAALTAKHSKTATMATSQGNSKVASSNWKYRQYFSPILNKGKNVSVTCSYVQEKRLNPRLPQAIWTLRSINTCWHGRLRSVEFK